MDKTNLKLHDVHIHTHKSLCSGDPTATVENILQEALALGVSVVGISDHMWDSKNIPTTSGWYSQQSYETQLSGREKFPKFVDGIRLVWGCETELAMGKLGITHETAAKLDYVLIPHSHLHMKGFVLPDDTTTPVQIAKYMLKTFKEAVSFNLPVPTGIAHPFDSCLGYDILVDFFSHISDSEFEECFKLAHDNNISLEINMSSFEGDTHGLFYRMYKIAKKMNCFFHFGSDAHSIDRLKTINTDDVLRIMDELELTDKDIWPFIHECQQ